MKRIVVALLVASLGCASVSAYNFETTSNTEQCAAVTKKGTRCKLKAENGSRYCKTHNPKAKKCQARTKKGKKCKRNAKAGSRYCWQHQNYRQD